jgi:hypothetical protein
MVPNWNEVATNFLVAEGINGYKEMVFNPINPSALDSSAKEAYRLLCRRYVKINLERRGLSMYADAFEPSIHGLIRSNF